MATTIEILTPTQLRDLLVTVIAGVKSEPEAKWRKIVGEVEDLSAWRHPAWNWRVRAPGLSLIEKMNLLIHDLRYKPPGKIDDG